MLLNRTFSHLAVGLLILLMGASAIGQDLEGMQLFAPADVSSYGRGPQPNEGFFFVYDLLYWTISKPRVSTIGKEGLTTPLPYILNHTVIDPTIDQFVQPNELDTGGIQEVFDLGNRIELGRIYDDRGWMVSYYQLTEQSQSIPAHDVAMVFNQVVSGTVAPYDPLDGRFASVTPPPATTLLALPVNFTNVLMRDDVSSWGVELDYVGRSEQLHDGGFFEWFIGPRYLEFEDTFLVNAQGSVTLGNSQWITEAQNHIIAGQLGARWFKKLGRWMLSTEGRGLIGLDCQNINQTGDIGVGIVPGVVGSGQPYYLGPTAINHNDFIRQFSEGVELRLDARYQITRSVSFRAGWSGLWLNNIARGSEMVDYTLDPARGFLGILRDHNKDNVLMNGLEIGIDVNR
ncbi:MAG: BBP7 family outer membrane beta-barrel protein [Thermoguttaceae bacterium]